MSKKLFKLLYVACLNLAMVFVLLSCGNEDPSSVSDTYTAIFETGIGYTFRNETNTADLPNTFRDIEYGGTIRFRVELADEFLGTFVVTAAIGGMITGPDANVYTLTVTGNTTVSVSLIPYTPYTVTFSKDEGYTFRNEDDTADLPDIISGFGDLEFGVTIRFRIMIDVAGGYTGWPIVSATWGSTVSGPDDGVYTLRVAGNTLVFVSGIDFYEFTIWSENGANAAGSLQNGFSITVEAGDTVYVNVKISGRQPDMFDVWFVLTEVNLGDLIVDTPSFNDDNIHCNFNAKWIVLPAGLTGSVVIEFWDIIAVFGGGMQWGYMGTLVITVIEK